ncbi:MAG: tetratricopeptide repeat protein [Parvularculaceae bacterium]|nr:tetratricopeptide repeat protein [Parvularculaceae bacterium]
MRLRSTGVFLGLCVAALSWAAPSSAQLSVTTFGASNARGCYIDASGPTTNTEQCDKALSEPLAERDLIATLVNRGIIRNRAGKWTAAIADFDQALARDPTTPEAWLNRGNSLLLMNKPDEAIANYEKALANNLGEAHVAWHNIGLAWYAKANLIRARAAFRKALELKPDFEESAAKLKELEGKRGENDEP